MRPAGRIPPIAGVDWSAALLSYRGPARELVARAKYRNQRVGLRWLAAGMAALVAERSYDLVTWAPATPAHAASRGFDHSQLLAKPIARGVGVPARSVLSRGAGAALTGRSAAQRQAGPPLRGRPSVRAYPLANLTVLVVDDVITTGATLAAAARVLRSLGAARVEAVAAAYTPVSRSALSPAVENDVPCR